MESEASSSKRFFRFASLRAAGGDSSWPHSHDDDFLFEQQRDRSHPWFRTTVKVETEVATPAHDVETPATYRDDSLRDVARDAVSLFRRLVQLAVRRKPTS